MHGTGEGVKRYTLPVVKQISHGDKEHSIEHRVNNGIILYGDRW